MRNILPNSILPTCYKLKVGIESDNVAMLELNFPDIEDSKSLWPDLPAGWYI